MLKHFFAMGHILSGLCCALILGGLPITSLASSSFSLYHTQLYCYGSGRDGQVTSHLHTAERGEGFWMLDVVDGKISVETERFFEGVLEYASISDTNSFHDMIVNLNEPTFQPLVPFEQINAHRDGKELLLSVLGYMAHPDRQSELYIGMLWDPSDRNSTLRVLQCEPK